MLKPLIAHFWRLCRFRAGPQDTPYSFALLIVILFLNFALAVIFLQIPANETETEIELAGKDPQATEWTIEHVLKSFAVFVGTTSTFVSFLLLIFGYKKRIIQTLTSLFGVELMLGVLILFAVIPLALIPSVYNPVILVLFFALGLRFAIHAHIFRHALSVSELLGWMISISLFFLLVLIQQYFFPVKN